MVPVTKEYILPDLHMGTIGSVSMHAEMRNFHQDPPKPRVERVCFPCLSELTEW